MGPVLLLAALAGWSYEVRVAPDLGSLTVRGCAPDGDCTARTVPLLEGGPGFRVTQPDFWLRPRTTGAASGILRLHLPPGVQASVPWRPIGPGLYEVPSSTFHAEGRAVFGRFEQRLLEVSGASFDVVSLGRAPAEAADGLLRDAALGVATLFGGRFPRDRVQALVFSRPGRRVGFGMASRGGGPAVVVTLGEEAAYEEVRADWTVMHEIAHLAMPRLAPGHAWLGEGLATYYQWVLLGRIGRVGPERAWSKLHDGFRRGARTGTDRPLEAESRDMGQTHAYWRVYWAGAAWALRADVELRRRGRSLDEVVRHWRACCPDERTRWHALPVLHRADEWLGEPLLVPLAKRQLGARGFPDLLDLYRALGLEVVDERSVRLRDDAPEADLRRRILGR